MVRDQTDAQRLYEALKRAATAEKTASRLASELAKLSALHENLRAWVASEAGTGCQCPRGRVLAEYEHCRHCRARSALART